MWTVAAQLGLEEDGELLQLARQLWPEWNQVEPRLGVVEGLDDLRGWLDSASHAEADEVLLALAMLAAPDGGDDLAAAAALAKCLLPGAARLAGWISGWLVDTPARRVMRDLQPIDAVSPRELINQVVAAELWIQVRSFPWRRLTKVAANIVTETRIGTLRQLGPRKSPARTACQARLSSSTSTGTPRWWGTATVIAGALTGNPAGGPGAERAPQRPRTHSGWRACTWPV